jgi:TonB family protein
MILWEGNLGMQKPTPLQICFGTSILLHVVVIGLCRVYGLGPFSTTNQRETDTDIAITLTLVSAPEDPAATQIIQKKAPLPKATLEPVKTAAPFDPGLPVQPESKSVALAPAPPEEPLESVPVAIAQPNYLKNSAPEYPAAARRRHEEGLVVLNVEVTPEGHARKVNIKKSSGFDLLDNAAVNAVENWEFEPARVGSVSLESEVEVPIRFQLTRH